MIAVRALDPQEARRRQGELVALLRDAVEGGASVGFVLPLAPAEPEACWQSVVEAIASGRRKLLAALLDEPIVGAVQLDLEPRANGRHRADVMKLMVLRAHRRHGVGRQLMRRARPGAGHRAQPLLLDVRTGDPAEALYRSLGFVKFGEVPRHARSPDGRPRRVLGPGVRRARSWSTARRTRGFWRGTWPSRCSDSVLPYQGAVSK